MKTYTDDFHVDMAYRSTTGRYSDFKTILEKNTYHRKLNLFPGIYYLRGFAKGLSVYCEIHIEIESGKDTTVEVRIDSTGIAGMSSNRPWVKKGKK